MTALFGEKYEQDVCVVNVGGFSQELCGGTHVHATGEIGAFAVVSESAIQAGVRRLEAVTGVAAVQHMQGMRRALRESAALLKGGEHEVPERIQSLLDKMKELKKALPKKSKSELGDMATTLVEKAERVGDSLVVAGKVDGVDSAELGQLINKLRGTKQSLCGVLGIVVDGKPQLAVFATDDLAPATLKAGDVIGQIAPLIGGGGGGSPTMARAGGKNAGGIVDAVQKGGELLRAALS